MSGANKNKKPKHDPEQGGKKEPLGRGARRLRCSKDHELAGCEQFISDEILARLDIVKRNKLLHVCLKSDHMRGRCESRIFCSSGSDRIPIWRDKGRYRQHRPTSSTRIKECNFLKIEERWNSTQPSQKLLQELFYCALCKLK